MSKYLEKGVWIQWNQSGDCPVPKGAVIHAKNRDDTLWENCVVGRSADIDDYFWTIGASWGNQIGSYYIVSLPDEVNPEEEDMEEENTKHPSPEEFGVVADNKQDIENQDSKMLSLISLIADFIPEAKAKNTLELAHTMINNGWTKEGLK